MKLKIKQNIYVHSVGRLVDVNEVIEIENEDHANDIINAGYGEEHVEKKARKKAGDE